MKIAHYHLGQLNWPVSQINLQRIMHGFLVEGHIWWNLSIADTLETAESVQISEVSTFQG